MMTMKQLTLLTGFLAAGLIMSCAGQSENNESDPRSTTGTVAREVSAEDSDTMETPTVKPMTPAEYEAWVPQSILNVPLTESGPNDHSDIPTQGIRAYYDNDAGKNIELRITDMTGELANHKFAYEMTIGKERNDRDWGSHYRKAVQQQGYVANETHDKNKLYTFLRFIHEDRYLVSIKANGFTPDELWNNLNEFQIDKLN